MLFYLTNSLIVDKTDGRYKEVYKAVRNLAIAADECNHELQGDFEVVNYWLNIMGEDPASSVLRNILDNFSTTTIPTFITEYIEVVLDKAVRREEEDRIIYQVEYGKFSKTKNCEKTIVIGEDENDCKMYEEILRFYKLTNKIDVNTNLSRIHGGGESTARVLETHVNIGNIIVCIVDNDRRYPSGPIGNTASECTKVAVSHPLSRLHILDALEIENLFPKDLIDALDWTNGRQQNKQQFDGLYNYFRDKEDDAGKNKYRYVDIKKGYTKHNHYSSDIQWVAFVKECCINNDALPEAYRLNFDTTFSGLPLKSKIMDGLSSTLTKDILSFIKVCPNFIPTVFLPFQEMEWRNIGCELLNTCICRNEEALNI